MNCSLLTEHQLCSRHVVWTRSHISSVFMGLVSWQCCDIEVTGVVTAHPRGSESGLRVRDNIHKEGGCKPTLDG